MPLPHHLSPDPAALAHSQRLHLRILDEIARAGGAIGFDRYMELALYAPGLGYYMAGARKFGPAGDFVTAPELSPLFGQVLARQCAQLLRQLGAKADLLELGAGTGALVAALLPELQRQDSLPRRYLILEPSADLRQRQQVELAALPAELKSRIQWLDRLPEPPLRAVILGNEVLDALPVKRFQQTAQGWLELGVGQDAQGELTTVPMPAADALLAELDALAAQLPAPLPADYVSEFSLRMTPLIMSLAERLTQGAMLWIDYGMARHEYYHPERRRGTLICHYRHTAHEDFYRWPGLQDLTAWVDFTALAEAGLRAGLQVLGYTTQAHFLMSAGLLDLLAELQTYDPVVQYRRAQEVKQLTLPGEMGEHFKLMLLGRDLELACSGFSGRDLRDRLLPRRV